MFQNHWYPQWLRNYVDIFATAVKNCNLWLCVTPVTMVTSFPLCVCRFRSSSQGKRTVRDWKTSRRGVGVCVYVCVCVCVCVSWWVCRCLWINFHSSFLPFQLLFSQLIVLPPSSSPSLSLPPSPPSLPPFLLLSHPPSRLQFFARKSQSYQSGLQAAVKTAGSVEIKDEQVRDTTCTGI